MERQGCGLIKDLLKLYAAGDISDESVSCIEAHAEDCPQCRMEYNAVKRGIGTKSVSLPRDTEKTDSDKTRTIVIVALIVTFPLWLPLLLVLLTLLAAFIACVFVAALVISVVPLVFAAASICSLVVFISALFRTDLPAAVIAFGASLASGGLMLALGLPCIRLCRVLLHLIMLIFSAFMRLITGGSIGTEE